MVSGEVDALAAQLYESVLEPDKWQESLSAIAKAAGARGMTLALADLDAPTSIIVGSAGQSAEMIESYHAQFRQMDPLLQLGRKRLCSGQWLSDWALHDASYSKSTYYNEFMLPHDNHAVLFASLWEKGPHTGFVALQRSKAQGVFSSEPTPFLASMLPHLRRASRLFIDTMEMRSMADLARATLDRLSSPLFIVAHDGRILVANAAAEHLCRRCHFLRWTGDRLSARTEDAALQKAIRGATTRKGARAAWIRLRSAASEDSLHVIVSPLSASSHVAREWQQPVAVLLVNRPTQMPGDILAMLRDMYQLTATEASVGRYVAEGLSLTDIAERHQVAPATVRVQLKAIFSKMGIRRQADLSRLVAGLQAVLPQDLPRETAATRAA